MKFFPTLWCHVILLSVFIAGSTAFSAEPEGGKWILIGFTKYRDAVFMDKNTTPSHNNVKVWAKIAPSEKSKYYQKMKNELRKSGKSAKGYKYSEMLNEIDCGHNRIRYLQVIYYNKKGTTMHTVIDNDPEWKSIVPGSLWENMQRNACKK